jgi:hypothetical protein
MPNVCQKWIPHSLICVVILLHWPGFNSQLCMDLHQKYQHLLCTLSFLKVRSSFGKNDMSTNVWNELVANSYLVLHHKSENLF